MTAELDFVDRPLVYVAGPYARPDPVENTHAAVRFGMGLADAGYCTPVIPHVTLLAHLIVPKPPEFWYAYDLAMLARCDAVFRLPGDSWGADREVEFAESRGIPVFRGGTALELWCEEWTRKRERS